MVKTLDDFIRENEIRVGAQDGAKTKQKSEKN